jgi:mannosyl-3-phosphoglycerate phosphatase
MTAAPRARRLFFADIDGTLWCGGERRAVLRRRVCRAMEAATLVLASSRTIEEILDLEARLGVETDFIAENGAQIGLRDPALARALGGCEPLGGTPVLVRDLAAPLRQVMPVVERAAAAHGIAGLLRGTPGWPGGPPSAGTPPFRRSSLLLPRPLFADGAHAGFLADLRAGGLEVVDGGEWTTISRGASKGRAARAYAAAAAQLAGAPVATAAIGNSDNDEPLLAAVDRPFVIRNPGGHAAVLARIPGAELLGRPACAGWLQAVRRLEQEDT